MPSLWSPSWPRAAPLGGSSRSGLAGGPRARTAAPTGAGAVPHGPGARVGHGSPSGRPQAGSPGRELERESSPGAGGGAGARPGRGAAAGRPAGSCEREPKPRAGAVAGFRPERRAGSEPGAGPESKAGRAVAGRPGWSARAARWGTRRPARAVRCGATATDRLRGRTGRPPVQPGNTAPRERGSAILDRGSSAGAPHHTTAPPHRKRHAEGKSTPAPAATARARPGGLHRPPRRGRCAGTAGRCRRCARRAALPTAPRPPVPPPRRPAAAPPPRRRPGRGHGPCARGRLPGVGPACRAVSCRSRRQSARRLRPCHLSGPGRAGPGRAGCLCRRRACPGPGRRRAQAVPDAPSPGPVRAGFPGGAASAAPARGVRCAVRAPGPYGPCARSPDSGCVPGACVPDRQ